MMVNFNLAFDGLKVIQSIKTLKTNGLEHKLSKPRKTKARQITIKMTTNFEKPSIKISFVDMVKLEGEKKKKQYPDQYQKIY